MGTDKDPDYEAEDPAFVAAVLALADDMDRWARQVWERIEAKGWNQDRIAVRTPEVSISPTKASHWKHGSGILHTDRALPTALETRVVAARLELTGREAADLIELGRAIDRACTGLRKQYRWRQRARKVLGRRAAATDQAAAVPVPVPELQPVLVPEPVPVLGPVVEPEPVSEPVVLPRGLRRRGPVKGRRSRVRIGAGAAAVAVVVGLIGWYGRSPDVGSAEAAESAGASAPAASGPAAPLPSGPVASSPAPSTAPPSSRAPSGSAPGSPPSSPSASPTPSPVPSPPASAPASAGVAAAVPADTGEHCRGPVEAYTDHQASVDVCYRRSGDDLYMIGYIQSAARPLSVDLYLWLKDGSGTAVYPTDHAVAWTKVTATVPQARREAKIAVKLNPGTTYSVCFLDFPTGSPTPKFNTPGTGRQVTFVY
ncbi:MULTISPECIES: hypothetical protein [Kitasatospora]|uniref:Uncharacterized protein n=1 Tax=Kitasatospora setae (strain ATCC 33774 / DSM 43861 / JCM 3304 / KCC A-0304 / NBRC 14216 / KM-6054) TaxID=452652 RepID=E4MYY1_KITSK|nr:MULTISPECIES: hypothetical protein [Kitasatospora]BAJ25874.1 hypothetical protein KSE_00210t [Kitasatospora setae KM-6054]BAJ33404.1 hypothetical protein KSE_76530t [Kitasatospora setae KM-6054]